jgi:Zn-dependent M28 family amino/carboxypeptidase
MFLASALVLFALRPATVPPKPVLITPEEKAAARRIDASLLRSHVRFLADDLLEGRGPATRGDRLAQLYVATQMEGLGLEPAGPNGSWFQPFEIVGIDAQNPETVSFAKDSQKVDLKFYDDYVAMSGVEAPEVRLEQAEVVFVGFGIVAPEYQWDDFKGADVKDKVLLVMNNDPEDDPALFGGKTRFYYGRWSYKYERGAEMGAAGVIVIHTTPSAGYGWKVIQTSNTGEQFSLPHESEPQLQVKAWATEDAAKKIAALGGQDLDALRAAAQKRDFKPVPLGVRVSLALKNKVRRAQTANVIGRLPGRDPVLGKEAVIYTAHHDHLGMKESAKPGEDAIFNGAMDNATGVSAILAIARAMKALPAAPRRSVLFAAVAAEEQGLLGAKYYAAHPTLAPGRLAANINIDGMSIFGPTRDVVMIGFGKSELDGYVKSLAALQGRVVVPDQFPDKGFFYRSDQFALAKIGVPAAYFDDGVDVIGKPAGWGKAQKEAFEAKDYHQPSDQLRDDWDFTGFVQDAQLTFYLGLKVANAPAMPSWNKGDEFEAARKKALAEVR